MILANVLSGIINPIATIFGWLLAGFFSFSHSYGVSIILLTLVTMIVVFPLTRKGTRSMMQMQLLQPELLKLRNKHKVQPGMSAQEKQEVRQEQQQEMMALYRENGVSPTGGCLPMFLQFPIFIVLYDTIRGMTRTRLIGKVNPRLVSDPLYIHKHTALYTSLAHSAGKLNSFGLNLAASVRTHQHSWVDVIPYVVVILIAVALQYISIWQITNRNPAASQANPQMQAAQKFMPLIFIVFYIVLPAGVGIYFIVSSMFRVAQQEYMYKHDPHIVAAVQQLTKRKAENPTPAGPKKGFRQMLREAAGEGASRASLEPNPREGGSSPRAAGQRGGNRAAGASSNGRPAGKGQSRSGQQSRNGQPSGRRPAGTSPGVNRSGKSASAGGRPQGSNRKPAPGDARGARPPRASDDGTVADGRGRTDERSGSAPQKNTSSGPPKGNRPRRPPGSGGSSAGPGENEGGKGPSGTNGQQNRAEPGRTPDANGSASGSGSKASRESRRPRRPA